MRHVHLVPSYCAEFESMLCFKEVVLEVILVFMAKTFIFMYFFLVKAVPPSLKWVFSRNPTETGYADKEIFKVLSPSFSPTQSIQRQSLFMFWRRRPVSFVVNVSVKISIIHGFTDWFIFFSPAKQLSSAPPFLVISFWNKLCTVFWLFSSFLTTPKSM